MWRVLWLLLVPVILVASSAIAGSPTGVSPKDQFLQKLRAAPKDAAPLECNGEKILKTSTNAYTEIIFRDGCKILLDLPADASCCVALSADVWRFPDGIASKYFIGYAIAKGENGVAGEAGPAGRDWNRAEPGGGGSAGGSGGNGRQGGAGKTLARPGSIVLVIGKGVFNQTHRLGTSDIAKIDFFVDVSGAQGGGGGVGGAGGKGGNGEGGANGRGRTTQPCLGGGRGEDPCPGNGEFRCTSEGRPGGPGGPGGAGGLGGQGGRGGDASNLDIYAPAEVINGISGNTGGMKSSWKFTANGGQGGPPGISGQSGAGGLGGFSGQTCGGGSGANGSSPVTPPTPTGLAGETGRPGSITFHRS